MVPLSHNDGGNVDGLILKEIPNWKTKMAQNSGGQSPNVSPNESPFVGVPQLQTIFVGVLPLLKNDGKHQG